MKLTAFEYGKTFLSEKRMFLGIEGNTRRQIALLFFLIENGDRKLLVDTGCEELPGFVITDHQSPLQLLRSYGVRPEQITDVFLTHGHHDHAGCAGYYPNATIYLHEQARKAASPYLAEGARVKTFRESLQLWEGLMLRHVGGHSAGSSIALMQTPHITWVLCGDECYSTENLERRIPTGSSVCPAASEAFINAYCGNAYRPVIFHDPVLVGENGYKTLYG